MKLLNSTALAKELGVSRWVPSAVKLAGAHWGDSPFVGRFTTVEKFMAWMEKHPTFVASHWHRGETKLIPK